MRSGSASRTGWAETSRDRFLPRKYTLLRVIGVPLRFFLRRLRMLFSENENALFFVAACLVGLLGGLAAAVFRWLFDFAVHGFWGRPGDLVFAAMASPWFVRLAVPALGGALAAAIAVLLATRRATRGGFPEILEAISLGGRLIRLTPALGRSASSLMTLASGGAVGSEGPMSQIAAAVGSRIGRIFRFSEERVRILVAAGMAAGFAAAYNTPIGGTLFVLEIVIGSFNMLFFGPAVVAAVIATLVTRFFVGAGPIYPPGAGAEMVSAWEVPPYLALGFLAGLASVLFQATMERMYRLWDRPRLPLLLRTPLGGLFVGSLAVFWPHVLGNGYEGINLVLAGRMALGLMAVLFLVKMLATTATLASGGAGGVFTATMFLGAMLGGVLGAGLHAVFPGQTGSAATYALAGMAGLVAGTTHAPFLAIIMLIELTQSYALALPLMLTSIMAYWTARTLRPTSIYADELRRRGMPWEGNAQERLMRSLKVRDIMLTDVDLYPESMPLERIIQIFQDSRRLQLYIGDDDQRLLGIVELHEVKRMLGEDEYEPLVIAADLLTEIPTVMPDDSLVEVNEKLWLRDLGQLPVVDDPDERRFLGVVTRRDVLGAFDREVLKRNALLAKVRAFEGEGFDYLELPAAEQMARLPVPSGMVGQALRETGLREKYGLSVIAIQRVDGAGRELRIAPRADTTLRRGDLLVVMGERGGLDRLRRG